MYDREVKRLPVVDRAGRLAGIISRSDVLAVFDRTDAEIREEIMSQVIMGRSEPSWYSGVISVRDRLAYPVPPVPSRAAPLF
jgi:CBS domain-containing protein